MRTSRFWQAVVVLAAAVTMLTLASGGSANSSAGTCTAGSSAALNACLAGAATTVVIKPGTYYTADDIDGNTADGFNAPAGKTITGKTNSSGNCTNTATTIVDGDHKPATTPGHTGVVFTVDGDNVQFKCFTMRFGTAGISSDGWNGLNVNNMNFVGNGRDTTAGTPDGDAIWVQDGNNVKINGSTFSGMGLNGVESDISLSTSNTGWRVKKNVFKNIHNSCLLLDNNTNAVLGELVSGKPANGNTCSVLGTFASDPAINVNDQGVGGVNAIYANTVSNSWRDCYNVAGDGAIFKANTCITSQNGRGVYFTGDNIVADGFSTTISSGHTNGNCVESDGDNLNLTNTKCGATRDSGLVINGLGSRVTNASVKQTVNTCLLSSNDNQVWNTVSCDHVTGSGEYGLEASSSAFSTFTKMTIGDSDGSCFYLNTNDEQLINASCGSSNSDAIYLNDADLVLNGFTVGHANGHCVIATTTYSNALIKNGHCVSVSGGNSAIQEDQNAATIDTVVVDAATGDCFAVTDDDVTLKNSTGTNCGTGVSPGYGVNWTGAGTASITNNSVGESADENLLVAVAAGDFTITNNKFHNAANGDCVGVGIPDTLTMTGNKAQSCYDSAFQIDVNTNPIVNSNIGNDASSKSGGATLQLVCETTCDSGQVNTNKLDGGGNEADGLLVTNGSGGTGLTISGNTVTNMSGNGIVVDGAQGANTLTNNVVVNSSDVDNLFGIFLNSDNNTLTGSNVSGGFDNGIEVAGDGNTVNSNQSHDNGEDGIHIASTANLTSLNLNKTLNNAGEGTEDDGTNTTITNNTSSGNRQDCAGSNAGGGTYTPGNTCADGSTFLSPGVITAPIRKHHT